VKLPLYIIFVDVYIHFRIWIRIRNPRVTDPDPAKVPDPCRSGSGSTTQFETVDFGTRKKCLSRDTTARPTTIQKDNKKRIRELLILLFMHKYLHNFCLQRNLVCVFILFAWNKTCMSKQHFIQKIFHVVMRKKREKIDLQ
jgi:hypothetical protein